MIESVIVITEITTGTEEDKIDMIEDTSAQDPDRDHTQMTEEEVQNLMVIGIGMTERGTTGIER